MVVVETVLQLAKDKGRGGGKGKFGGMSMKERQEFGGD